MTVFYSYYDIYLFLCTYTVPFLIKTESFVIFTSIVQEKEIIKQVPVIHETLLINIKPVLVYYTLH